MSSLKYCGLTVPLERTLTEDTPFGLAFGMKAVIHVEIGLTSFQVENYGPGLNDKGLKLSIKKLSNISTRK